MLMIYKELHLSKREYSSLTKKIRNITPQNGTLTHSGLKFKRQSWTKKQWLKNGSRNFSQHCNLHYNYVQECKIVVVN